jgi:hypothetical protein
MIQPLKGKCSHPQCACTVPGTTAYCSDYCSTAAPTEACRCGHEECMQHERTEAGAVSDRVSAPGS